MVSVLFPWARIKIIDGKGEWRPLCGPAGDIIPVAASAGAGLGAFYTDAPGSGMDNWAD